MKILFTAILILISVSICSAADVKLSWDASEGATGYQVQLSSDMGATWSAPVDVGNQTTFVYPGIPDKGLQLLRVGAYKGSDVSIRYDAFIGVCKDCGPPPRPGGIGVE